LSLSVGQPVWSVLHVRSSPPLHWNCPGTQGAAVQAPLVASQCAAFVQIAVEAGLDAWGQDPAVQNESDRVYRGDLVDVAFPTADFDAVTLHDVLEHVPDPIAFLTEIKRVMKPGGRLIIDFPRFWDEAGVHHWKLVEHLLMLTGNQLMGLLQRTGFEVETVSNPIPSKIVILVRLAAVFPFLFMNYAFGLTGIGTLQYVIATFIGIALALSLPIALLICASWIVMARASRYSSLAALFAAALAPIYFLFIGATLWAALMAVLAVLIFISHRANIARLIRGQEPQIGAR